MNHNVHKTSDDAIAAGKQELTQLLQHFLHSADLGTTEIRERYDSSLDGWVVQGCWFARERDNHLQWLVLRQLPSGSYLLEANVNDLPYSLTCDKPDEAILCLRDDLNGEAERHDMVAVRLRSIANLFVEPDEPASPVGEEHR